MSVGLALWAGHGSRSRSDKINLVTLPPPLRGDILSLAVESSSYKRVTMQLLCVVVDAVVEPIASKDTMIYVARLAPRFCQLGRLWLHGGSLFENLRSSLKRPENRICHDISYLWSREKGKVLDQGGIDFPTDERCYGFTISVCLEESMNWVD